jgi:hypothetical protein
MSPWRCAEIGKLLLISSLQLLDSTKDELRGEEPGLDTEGGRGTAGSLENNLRPLKSPKRLEG